MADQWTIETVKEKAKQGELDTVLTVFPDHYGRLMGKSVDVAYFLKEIAQDGMHACNYLLTTDMDMTPLPSFEFTSWEKGYGDFRARPDLATLRPLPWRKRTCLVICDLFTEAGEPVEESPRRILKRQIEAAGSAGMTPMMASELEFYIYAESYDEIKAKGFRGLKPTTPYLIDYHILGSVRDEDLLQQLRNNLNLARVPVEFSKGEWGEGQHEINIEYAQALEMADRHVIYKLAAKELAMQHGKAITFMAKPDSRAAGSSCHIHTSLVDTRSGQSIFWNTQGEGPSVQFSHFLGGLMEGIRELAYFYAPTVNAYKRYQEDSFAPTRIAWGQDNRTCGFRIVGHGQSLRVENRIPGADANPYLAFAATIAAGLRGIKKRIVPPAQFEGNAYAAGEIARFPSSMDEALALMKDNWLVAELMGAQVIEHYTNLARLEAGAYRKSVTDWERERYFEQI